MKPKENPSFATALKKSALSFTSTLPLLLGSLVQGKIADLFGTKEP
jgi:hypothetical protein